VVVNWEGYSEGGVQLVSGLLGMTTVSAAGLVETTNNQTTCPFLHLR
jgi:hypothetical protein